MTAMARRSPIGNMTWTSLLAGCAFELEHGDPAGRVEGRDGLSPDLAGNDFEQPRPVRSPGDDEHEVRDHAVEDVVRPAGQLPILDGAGRWQGAVLVAAGHRGCGRTGCEQLPRQEGRP